MATPSLATLLIAAVVLVWLIGRQLRTQPIREPSSLRVSGILALLGVWQVGQLAETTGIPAPATVALATSLVSAATFGWLRGRSFHVWAEGGVPTSRGTVWTVLLWVLGFAVHFGLDQLAVFASSAQDRPATAAVGPGSILLYLAVTLGMQRLVVMGRAGMLRRPSHTQLPAAA